MNDIIILGNGFDLAHGLKTGYKDYVRAMLIDSLSLKAGFYGIYQDSPFKLSRSINNSGLGLGELEQFDKKENRKLCELYNSLLELSKDDESRFIGRIIEDFESKGWVDLEETFFSILKESITEDGIDRDRIKVLNKQMEELGLSLCQYLGKITETAGTEQSQEIQTHFEEIAKRSINRAIDILNRNKNELISRRTLEGRSVTRYDIDALFSSAAKELSSITVLTFNYTDTCEVLYKDALTIEVKDIEAISQARRVEPSLSGWIKDDITPTFIHIHGSLKEEDIVLGYGDETTDKFRELEDANDNELTKYFKSFYYMQNPRYRQFFEVLERGPFRLHLMGHSCGLSDRVLLSSIFNHPNLEDVRIYYHDKREGPSDYFQLCQNISRHFHDKHAMRRKILPCKGEDLNMMSVPLISSLRLKIAQCTQQGT